MQARKNYETAKETSMAVNTFFASDIFKVLVFVFVVQTTCDFVNV
jgi:hypothetical protein